ncbi:gap junction delta-3 protein-like [Corythoichthys intestinalis]|uniref:gap junction delta-3 protein-like n=1 Tax=Corythoichthys intestinalis TaxID=161448 RepID=UPI0025A642A5|nr:gap junction delta-3 protein-like [Corythoichthys intestinalis]XP_061807724.1 gap junction delta-3 protein-like [Nerophis lumbriciformis]
MGEWDFLSGLFDHLQAHSPMLGRFWLLLMLVFRILILGTVASDMFEDEQEEFACNTLQPGCKQVCYDQAFPISQYRFWVFHIVLIATPSLLFLMYAMHHHSKRNGSKSPKDYRESRQIRMFYIVHVAFRLVAEVGFLVGQWWLYGFKVEAQYPCDRFPCPYTVDCFTSRPAEKTVFLCFYFAVGVLSAFSSCVELLYSSVKWFCSRQKRLPTLIDDSYKLEKPQEKSSENTVLDGVPKKTRKGSSKKGKGMPYKYKNGKYVKGNAFVV